MSDVTIQVMPNGPYKVRGLTSLLDGEGAEIDLAGRETVALCRCGHSKNKPFCDATHREIGWVADGVDLSVD
jgi:CDGSH-type Zn-finger protein